MDKLRKFILGSSKSDYFLILVIFLLTIPTFFRLVRPGFFSMQDDLQAFRVYEMDKCFDDWQIPCRWVPDAGYQYGYPQFIYYPPSVYYAGAILHRLGFQYIDAVKTLFILGYIASAMAMFVLVKSFLGRWPGFIAAVMYSYVPYKAVEVYVRGALNEFWSLVFFPVILWSSYQLIKTLKVKYIFWLSFSLALLLVTHTLISMIFLPLFGIWVLFWLLQKKNKKVLVKLVFSGVLGVGLAAFYLLPLLLERKFAHLESLLSGYFDYRQHFVNLYKIFFSMEWGYGSSGFVNEKLNLSTGTTQWMIGLLAAGLAILNLKKKRKLAYLTLVLALTELGILFLMHLKSSFIWQGLPFLAWLQFPWRFLSVSIFLLAILSGLAVYFAKRWGAVLGIVGITSAFILYAGFFQPKDWLNISDKDKFSGASWEKQLTISIFDFLPIYATLPPYSKAPDLPEILQGDANFISYMKGSNFQDGEIEVSKDAVIRLPLFDFPGMKVRANGEVIRHYNNDCRNERYCLGLITFKLPKGKYKIEARLENTPVRKVGSIISLASLVGLGFFAVKNGKNEKVSK